MTVHKMEPDESGNRISWCYALNPIWGPFWRYEVRRGKPPKPEPERFFHLFGSIYFERAQKDF